MEKIFKRLEGFSANEVLRGAFEVEEVLRHIRLYTELEASKYIPEALESLREAACSGNVSALKLLFDVVGVTGNKAGKTTGVSVNNQILVLPEERDSIKQAYIDAVGEFHDDS